MQELAGELGFQRDDGERVAENIMQVAGDAFAFGDGGEVFDFFLGAHEFCAGAFFAGVGEVGGAENGGDSGDGSEDPNVDMEVIAMQADDGGNGGEERG